MKVTLWGTRGSLGRSGPETVDYGGDTASVQVLGEQGEVLVIDAGSGILRLGERLPGDLDRVDILLSHLHMDHIQGLGFFTPLYSPDIEVHIWGPLSPTMDLRTRLTRYLSPPLFPVRLRDLPALYIHDVEPGVFHVGPFRVAADLVSHPGSTLGFRVEDETGALAYLSDHEPALGNPAFPDLPDWTSGYSLARDADLLLHDAQYTDREYEDRAGWGHSTFNQAIAFAGFTGVSTLVTFHHDPLHADGFLDDVLEAHLERSLPFHLVPGKVGARFDLAGSRPVVAA